jgi:succinate-acetate transporter protein
MLLSALCSAWILYLTVQRAIDGAISPKGMDSATRGQFFVLAIYLLFFGCYTVLISSGSLPPLKDLPFIKNPLVLCPALAIGIFVNYLGFAALRRGSST